jgi:hypothetical protein
MLDFGTKHIKSAKYMQWVIQTNPAFSYLKPWYLKTISMGIIKQDLI